MRGGDVGIMLTLPAVYEMNCFDEMTACSHSIILLKTPPTHRHTQSDISSYSGGAKGS